MNSAKARHHPSLLYRISLLSLPVGLLWGAFMAVYRLLRTPLNSPELESSFLILILQLLVIAPMSIVIGFLIMRRSPQNIIGPLIAHYGIATMSSGSFGVADPFLAPLIQFYNQAVYLNVIFLILFYFPTGDTAFRGAARVLNAFILITPIYSVTNIMASPVMAPGLPPNPFYVSTLAPLTSLLQGLFSVILFPVMLMATTAVVLRYRAAEGREHAQIRWLALVAGSFFLLMIGWLVLAIMPGGMDAAMASDFGWLVRFISSTWFPAAIPIAVGLAILRHNLYDIDIIIRRTLVYGALTALLALIYWVGVAGLQAMLRPITGAGNDLAVVATTLLIAALVLPLRQRIQGFIDRRFFRRKYDAAKLLAAFSEHVRDEVELDKLAGRLVEVVEETMQPAHVTLWLRSPGSESQERKAQA